MTPMRRDSLLVIRAIACIVILWRHTISGFSVTIAGHDLTFLFLPNAPAAVFTLYFLSAYVIGYGFASGKYLLRLRSLFGFFLNRVLRIVPLYYFCLLVSPFLFYSSSPINLSDFIRLATFTATSTTTLSALRPWGIVSTEMQFYLVAPLLFLIIKKIFVRFHLIPSVIVWWAIGTFVRLLLLSQGMNDDAAYINTVYTTVLGNIDTFAIGILLSIYIAEKGGLKLGRFRALAFTAISLIFISWYAWSAHVQYIIGTPNWFPSWRTAMLFILPPTTSLIMGLLILLLWRSTGRIQAVTPKVLLHALVTPREILYALGVLSYGLYLWHVPIADLVVVRFGTPFGIIPTLFRAGVIFGLSLLFALGSYIVIEAPILKLRSRR